MKHAVKVGDVFKIGTDKLNETVTIMSIKGRIVFYFVPSEQSPLKNNYSWYLIDYMSTDNGYTKLEYGDRQ